MRLLFDARSVRTPAGHYVMEGLIRGWLGDHRVEEVAVALPPHIPTAAIPADARVIPLPTGDWLSHLARVLPAIARDVAADIVFSPNATAPLHARSVLYYQDLHHFQFLRSGVRATRTILRETLRSTWQHRVAPTPLLGIAVSEHIAKAAMKRHARLVVIPNGIDVPFGWRGTEDVVLVLGGRGSRKHEEVALQAWAAVAASERRTTIMELVGVEPIGRRERIVALAHELSIASAVRIVGSVPREELLAGMARARVAVSCSSLESFGLPVGEALAMGAPIICSDIPAHLELLDRAGAGRPFAVGQSASLAEALSEALGGSLPRRLAAPPPGWSWRDRVQEQVDAFADALGGIVAGPLMSPDFTAPDAVRHVRH